MPSVVYVHGTAARRPKAVETVAKIRDGLLPAPGFRVLPCLWGDELGVPVVTGPSIVPGGVDLSLERPVNETGQAAATWTVLDLDPLHDIRLLALAAGQRSSERPLLPGEQSSLDRFDAVVDQLRTDPGVQAELQFTGLASDFRHALETVCGYPWTRELAERTPVGTAEWPVVARSVAEAVVAFVQRSADDVDGLSSERRRHLVNLMIDALEGGQLGVSSRLGSATWEAVMRLGAAWALQRYRAPLDASFHPFVGDILRYLAHGDALRTFIERCVLDAEPPVVLLGHSLGGIACLDLLATRPVAGVSALLTVGSQGSQLWRMGALPGLSAGQSLPAFFPRWTNVYSRYDFLSYLAEPAFPGQVNDVELVSTRGMPAAHGAYFGDKRLYELIANQ